MDLATRLNEAFVERYRIERLIGEGGMATVFAARDVRHDRIVALKVLKSEVGVELAVERFLQEIRLTANLEHPHIVPLYDSGQVDGTAFYVMRYVEGESLRERLTREKHLPVREAVQIAIEVAQALEYAHRHGVIHRDIKPENILLHEGTAFVADFGIALAISRAGHDTRFTQPGMFLGTPQYMSPEHATGQGNPDARSDVYALGAVLYEMLAGQPAFAGPTTQAIVAQLVATDPRPVDELRQTVPRGVAAATHIALSKLPADRFASAREFADALREAEPVAIGKAPKLPPSIATDGRSSASARGRQLLVAATALLALLGAALWQWNRPATGDTTVTRFEIPLGYLSPTDSAYDVWADLALSPDGTELVYWADWDGPTRRGPQPLKRRPLGSLVASAIQGIDTVVVNPQFSPDGRWLLFVRGDKLIRVPAGGGAPTVVLSNVTAGYSIGTNDIVVLNVRDGAYWSRGLYLANLHRDHAAPLTSPDSGSGTFHSDVFVLPGAKAALFTITGVDSSSIATVRLADGRITRLGITGDAPRYVRTGHLLFGRDGGVYAVAFDLKRLRIVGEPSLVLEGASPRELSISENGTLVYVDKPNASRLARRHLNRVSGLHLFTRSGKPTELISGPDRYAYPRFSPKADRIAMTIASESTTTSATQPRRAHIAIYEPGARTVRHLSPSIPFYADIQWMPDGHRLVWVEPAIPPETRARIMSAPWNESAPPTAIAYVPDAVAVAVSPKNDFLLVTRRDTARRDEIDLVLLDSARTRNPSVSFPQDQWQPSISPDGEWVAYTSGILGASSGVFIQRVGALGRYQVAANGARDPVWDKRDATLLYYRVQKGAQYQWTATRLQLGSDPRVIGRDTLFTLRTGRIARNTEFDVAPDGQSFVATFSRTPDMAAVATPITNPRIIVVTGWLRELEARMAQAKGR